MCGSQNKDVWLIQFNESGLVGMQGTVTGGWCMDCIYKMTGEREIDALPVTNKSAIMVFREIENICFIKKLREPTNLDKVSLDAIEVLKSVDF
jgi:hypothetical protein